MGAPRITSRHQRPLHLPPLPPLRLHQNPPDHPDLGTCMVLINGFPAVIEAYSEHYWDRFPDRPADAMSLDSGIWLRLVVL